jgi:hypothetical protein
VTINQAPSQVDPTRSAPVAFDVTFSESVTGFDDADVLLTGTAGATTASVSGSGASYTVNVSGMTVSGTVIASVKDGAAADAAGNPSTASTSTDNVVTFRAKGKPSTVKPVDLVSPASTYAGRSIPVTVKGLSSGESYTIQIDDQTVATGAADAKGKVKTKVTVPLSLQPGNHTISATGATADRTDTDDLLILEPLELTVDLKESVEAGGEQKLTVSNLLPGEGVEIRLDGELISPDGAVADTKGKYRLTFTAGSDPGSHEVEATGLYDGRTSSTTFTVVEAAQSARRGPENTAKNAPPEQSQPDPTADAPAESAPSQTQSDSPDGTSGDEPTPE